MLLVLPIYLWTKNKKEISIMIFLASSLAPVLFTMSKFYRTSSDADHLKSPSWKVARSTFPLALFDSASAALGHSHSSAMKWNFIMGHSSTSPTSRSRTTAGKSRVWLFYSIYCLLGHTCDVMSRFCLPCSRHWKIQSSIISHAGNIPGSVWWDPGYFSLTALLSTRGWQ